MSSATRVPCLSFALSTFDLHPTTYLGPDDALTITAQQIHVSNERATITWPANAQARVDAHIVPHPAASAPRR